MVHVTDRAGKWRCELGRSKLNGSYIPVDSENFLLCFYSRASALLYILALLRAPPYLSLSPSAHSSLFHRRLRQLPGRVRPLPGGGGGQWRMLGRRPLHLLRLLRLSPRTTSSTRGSRRGRRSPRGRRPGSSTTTAAAAGTRTRSSPSCRPRRWQ